MRNDSKGNCLCYLEVAYKVYFLGIYFVLVFEKHGQMATINDTSKSKPDVAVDRKFDQSELNILMPERAKHHFTVGESA